MGWVAPGPVTMEIVSAVDTVQAERIARTVGPESRPSGLPERCPATATDGRLVPDWSQDQPQTSEAKVKLNAKPLIRASFLGRADRI